MTLSYAPLSSSNSSFFKGISKYYEYKDSQQGIIRKWNGDIIETVCCGLGSKSKSSQTLTQEQKSYIENVNEQIEKKFMSSMTSIVQSNCVEVANKNQQGMQNTLSAANVFKFSNSKGKKLSIKDVNMVNNMDVDASMESENKVSNIINTSVSSKTSNQLSDMMKDSKKMGESLSAVANNAVNQVAGVANNTIDTVGDVANTGINAAADVAGQYIGAGANVAIAGIDALTGGSKSTSSDTNIKTDDTVINKILNKAETEIKLEETLNNAMETKITEESIQKCGSDIKANNEMNLDNLDYEEVELEGVNMENVIKAVIKCQFSNEVCNEIVTDFVNELTKKIENSSLTEEEQEGFGMALAAAAEGVGEGLGTAAEGVGEGVGTAAEGVGNMFGSMTYLIVAVVCLLVIALLGFVAMGGIGQTANAAATMKRKPF